MGNLFLTDLPIHRKYDLKGSTQGRFTKRDKVDSSTTLKDLDLDVTFKLEEGWHQKLHEQLSKDALLLESMNVMDYSLLLGVHYRKQGLEAIPELKPEAEQGHTSRQGPLPLDFRGKEISREVSGADKSIEARRPTFQ